MLATLSTLATPPDKPSVPLLSFYLCRADLPLASPDQMYYLALGQHELFLVDHDLTIPIPNVTVLSLPYASIEHLTLDPDDVELVRLDCFYPPRTVKPSAAAVPPLDLQLALRCVERRHVVEDLVVAIKTDFMFQSWEVHTRSLERQSKVQWRHSRASAGPPREAFSGCNLQSERRESLQSHSFFVPADYTLVSGERVGSHKVALEGPGKDAGLLFITVTAPDAYSSLPSVQTLCERAARDFCGAEWRVVQRPRPYVKKMNLTGDPAAWTCVEMLARTGRGSGRRIELRDVVIIACRRAHIPPTMLAVRDFVVIHASPRKAFDAEPTALVARRLVDSLSPEAAGFETDRQLAQAHVDALLLDAPQAYAWFHQQLHLTPSCNPQARLFVVALVRALARFGLLDLAGLPPLPPDDVQVRAAALTRRSRLFSSLLTRPPPQDDFMAHARAVLAMHADSSDWPARAAHYLALTLDDSGWLTLADVARHARAAPDKQARAQLASALALLLHLRAPDGPAYKPLSFLADEALMRRRCAFDPLVMARLLESGYLESLLEGEAYPRLLTRLLRLTDESLRYAVLKRLVEQSTSPEDALDEAALNLLVPVLVNSLVNHAQDDKLRVLVVVALINFSHRNKSVKQAILAGGSVRVLLDLLRSRNDDLVRHTCSLLTNLAQELAEHKAVAVLPALVALLEKQALPPHHRAPAILAQACYVLGNLAVDAGLRRLLVGDETCTRALVGLLDPPSDLAVQAGAAFCLKNLCVAVPGGGSIDAKKLVCKLGQGGLCEALARADVGDSRLLDALLKLVLVLCFDPAVCAQLARSEALAQALEARKKDVPGAVLQIQAKLEAARSRDRAE